MKREIVYPNGFVALSENDNIEMWIINLLTPIEQSLFRYLRIITHDGCATAIIKASYISEETKLSRGVIFSCLAQLTKNNMITRRACARKGIEININPVSEWHTKKKGKVFYSSP